MDFIRKNKFLFTMTPLYIGDGELGIGHVDNMFIRTKHSKEPYIPGTTLLGNYSHFVGQYNFTEQLGQNWKNKIFGSGSDDNNCKEKKKALRINSAFIVWIPCVTIHGIKLVTTVQRFHKIIPEIDLPDFKDDELLTHTNNLAEEGEYYWLNLKNLRITANRKKCEEYDKQSKKIKLPKDFPEIDKLEQKLVFVSKSVFNYIINKNMEIRTSVSIDKITGAGKTGALFTYELIPRWTLFSFEIMLSQVLLMEKEQRKKNSSTNKKLICEETTDSSQTSKTPTKPEQTPEVDLDLDQITCKVWEILDKAKAFFEFAGIGGMTTRGFGKCEIIDHNSKDIL